MCNVDHNNVTYTSCYCNEDQGYGYTYNDEYGSCAFCDGLFEEEQTIGYDINGELCICTCDKER
jgi:hypothetical protein